MDIVVEYLKVHKDVKVYVDNHADFSNSASNWVSLHLLHRIIWKKCAHLILPYTTKFYGVLPARVDFLENVYGLPKERIELLVMGADDEKVQMASDPNVRKRVRKKYGIGDEDFLIVTGGKIDMAKQQTVLLMKAINQLHSTKIKLLVFGSVVPELQEKVESECSELVRYIGWVKSEDTYDYFAAADLVAFPGRHSVFWEQVAGQGIPLLVKRWDGTDHVDMGSNVKFFENDSVEEVQKAISSVLQIDNYNAMLDAAKRNSKYFMYSEIAKRSIKE